MKKFILATMLVSFPTISFAEELCKDVKSILTVLKEKYQEDITYAGKLDKSDDELVITLNPSSKTFTILKLKEGKLCYLYSGDNWRPLFKDL